MSAVILLVLGVPLALLRGFVISTLWGWYVVTSFGAPSLGVVQAIGITLIAGLLLGARVPAKNEEPDVVRDVAWSLVISLVALVMGFLWRFAL